ncbi:hypothetical protein J6590_065630 [Homalodisca vitripennis]|nr:hypothetical protein J6590_065630 [Homalodisca vitripennis]
MAVINLSHQDTVLLNGLVTGVQGNSGLGNTLIRVLNPLVHAVPRRCVIIRVNIIYLKMEGVFGRTSETLGNFQLEFVPASEGIISKYRQLTEDLNKQLSCLLSLRWTRRNERVTTQYFGSLCQHHEVINGFRCD